MPKTNVKPGMVIACPGKCAGKFMQHLKRLGYSCLIPETRDAISGPICFRTYFLDDGRKCVGYGSVKLYTEQGLRIIDPCGLLTGGKA